MKTVSFNLNKVVLAGEVAGKIEQLEAVFVAVMLKIKSFNEFKIFTVLVDKDIYNQNELAEGNKIELVGKLEFIDDKIFVIADKLNKFFVYKNKVDLVGTLHSTVDTKNIKLIHTDERHRSHILETSVFVNYDNPLAIKKAIKEPHKSLYISGKLNNRSLRADSGLTEGYTITTLVVKQV